LRIGVEAAFLRPVDHRAVVRSAPLGSPRHADCIDSLHGTQIACSQRCRHVSNVGAISGLRCITTHARMSPHEIDQASRHLASNHLRTRKQTKE